MDMQLVCENCANIFSVPYRKNKIGKIRFCSLKCAGAATSSGVYQKECKECKTLFTVRASRPRDFCCNTCYQKNRKMNKSVHHCEVCSKEFETTSTRKDSARFCSKTCMTASPAFRAEKSEAMRGEKHWRWAGGKNQKMLSAYSTKKYRKLIADRMASLAPTHPFLVKRGDRVVLAKNVHIHHIDKDVTNNNIENLMAITIDAHAKLHHSGRKPEPWECWPSNPTAW